MSLDAPRRRADPQATHGRTAVATAALLLVGWAVVLGLVIGVGWLLTHPLAGSIGAIDDDLARWLEARRTPTLDDLAAAGTWCGETIVVLTVAPLLAIAAWIRTRSVVPAVFVALVTAGTGAIYLLAAMIDPRRRPPVEILDSGLVPTHSFPSGHVGSATALYGTVVVLAWTYAYGVRWWVTPILVLPLVVAAARLYQGAHHLSDVLTSLVFATAWLAVATRLLLAPDPR